MRTQATPVENRAGSDELTSLPNRSAWDERLPLELDRARREGWQLSVALFVVDDLEDLRSEVGEATAAGRLRETAFSFALQLRGTDVLARYGDDAFIAAFPGCRLGAATDLADRLRTLARGVTVSGGVACWDGEEAPERLVGRASVAAAAARAAGGDRVLRASTA